MNSQTKFYLSKCKQNVLYKQCNLLEKTGTNTFPVSIDHKITKQSGK